MESAELSGYLVVWRHSMDDVPIGLFSTEKEANEVAEKTSFHAGYDTANKLGIDCNTPLCFVVIRFDHGKPIYMNTIIRPDDG